MKVLHIETEERMGEATESLQSSLVFEGLPRWRWWAGKGSLAVLDQALISGSNFLITILLARWLTARQYGAYTLAFSIFLLLGSVHDSLVSEPMTVFGPSSHADHRREYLGALLKIEAVLGLVFVAVLSLSAVIAHFLAAPSGLTGALAGLTVSAPCVFLLWLARSALYVEQSPGSAALGGLLYCALVLSGTLLIFRRGLLSPFTAFIVVALGATASAVSMLVRLKPVLKRESNPSLSAVWNQHWNYGRWVLGTAAARWIPGNVLYALTGSLLGMAEVGGIRALLNLCLPVSQAANSLSNLVQPYIAGIYGKQGRAATRMPVSLVTVLYFGGGVVYWTLLTLCKGPILHFLYSGKFMEHAFLVPWVTLGALLNVCAYASLIGLKAIQSPSSVFAAHAASSVVALILGVVATWAFGLPGAIGSYVLSIATLLAVATCLFRRKASISPAVPEDH